MSKENILLEVLQELRDEEKDEALVNVLSELVNLLDRLDISIDYLTSSLTGEDPLNLSLRQTALGRYLTPTKEQPAKPQKKIAEQDIKISHKRLREIIIDEFNNDIKDNV